MSAPTLTTPRLTLRAHTLADFDAVAALWADPAVVEHISGVPSTAEESWSRLLRYIGHWEALGFGYWVVQDTQTGTYLGEAGLADYHRDMVPSLNGKPEAGWLLATNAWGHGYAYEAMNCLLAWADSELQADATVCIISPEHKASLKLARKVGFELHCDTQYRQSDISLFERTRRQGPSF